MSRANVAKVAPLLGITSDQLINPSETDELDREWRLLPLFAVKPFGGRLGPDYEVASDGQRFLFLLPGPVTPETSTGLIVVQNWTEELRQRIAH
jgi:hypothetical protein